jgi:prepilin-type N-terminal cleavage/methylation domain-containing protein
MNHLAAPFRGFTLLELIVSVAIFSMVMLTVTSAYLSLISLDRQARATSELSTNLSFALESMVRAMRTGKNYVCAGNASSCTSFSFTDDQGRTVTYYVRGTDGSIVQCIGACTDATAIPITDPRVRFNASSGLRFAVRGSYAAGSSDGKQPYVTIIARGTMQTDANKTSSFVIQTSAVQRIIDL